MYNGTSEVSMRGQFRAWLAADDAPRRPVDDAGGGAGDARSASTSSTAEARLIDEKRLEEWYELFAEEGRYWMPLTRGQKNGLTENSLMFEDKLLLKLRIARLEIRTRTRRRSRAGASMCCRHRHRGSRRGERHRRDAHAVLLCWRAGRIDQQVYAGVAWHHLKVVEQSGLAIVLKKVELLNCDAALPSLQLFP